MEFEESNYRSCCQMNLTARPVIKSLCRKKLVFIGTISIIILFIVISVEYGHKNKVFIQIAV